MATWGKFTVINASRVRTEVELSAFGKAKRVSTLQERCGLRDLAAYLPRNDGDTRSIPYKTWWMNMVAGSAIPMGATLALVWLATISLVVINYFVRFNLVSLIYMLPVVVAATQWGIGAGILAAVAGAAAADFFFYPPLYTLWIRDPQNVVDLALFLLIALVTSNLAARLKNEAVALRRRAKEITELHAFSQGLATCLTSRDLIFAVQDYLSNTLRYRAVLIATEQADQGISDSAAVAREVRNEAAKLIAAAAPGASIVVDPQRGRAWLVRVIAPEILGYGAIAVELGDSLGEHTDVIARRVGTLLEEATLTLRHLKTKEAIEQATINYRTEVLRDALVGGISHELRTPLASILGSCSVLNQMPAILNDRPSRELVDAIHEQAAQLDSEIRDLLNASRISCQGRASAADVDRPDGYRQRRAQTKGTKTGLPLGHGGCRRRWAAGSRRSHSYRTGVRPASGKRRKVFADGKRNQNQQPSRTGLRGAVGEGSREWADGRRERPVGATVVARARGRHQRIRARLVDCQHFRCRQRRQPACGESGAEPRHDDVAAAAGRIREHGGARGRSR